MSDGTHVEGGPDGDIAYKMLPRLVLEARDNWCFRIMHFGPVLKNIMGQVSLNREQAKAVHDAIGQALGDTE
jgi:hypothetical protein